MPKAADQRSMVGTSPAMVKVYRTIAKAALTRENVLIYGESGTGKELVARAIHENSACGKKPFVAVNCCALTETLLESELFGHVRGAFTGATQNKRGLFEEAHEGTLFLDEIGDLSPTLQVKLLRAIQEGEIKPVGATESRKVDVRLVAATHRDLTKAIQENLFREDLFYRLKVVLIEMPPLRERQKDIPDLVNYFLSRYIARTGKPITAISDDAMELLLTYPWPGNIRELENAVSRAATMASSNILYPEDFPSEILHTEEKIPVEHAVSFAAAKTSGESLEELEKRHIANTLEEVNHNKSKAAEILGIDRATLYRKAFKYGIFSKADSRSAGT
jgi:transcriptional regulator with PAS, ATPase and Fis domain